MPFWDKINCNDLDLVFWCEKFPGISGIDLTVEPSSLCAVVGPVGAGKSTLLQVILGELELDDGLMTVTGKISYASQEPWLFEGSVRRNILFVEEYDESRSVFYLHHSQKNDVYELRTIAF